MGEVADCFNQRVRGLKSLLLPTPHPNLLPQGEKELQWLNLLFWIARVSQNQLTRKDGLGYWKRQNAPIANHWIFYSEQGSDFLYYICEMNRKEIPVILILKKEKGKEAYSRFTLSGNT